jgi:DNA-binding CsgD family transcriptional regulator
MEAKRLLSVIGDLYEAATDPARLGDVSATVQRAMEVESCIIFAARHGSGQLLRLVSASANFDDKARADYRAHYHARNVWYQNAASREVPFRDDIVAVCGIHAPRSAGPFDEDRKRLFAGVVRHLGRVFQIADVFGTLRDASEVTLRLLEGLEIGVLLLDFRCRPLLVNAVADRLLRGSRWFSARGGGIRPVYAAAIAEFERRVALTASSSAGTGLASEGILSLPDPRRGKLAVLIAPFRSASLGLDSMQPAAAVIFNDPDAPASPDARGIAEVYGLTRAESRLVAALARGRTLGRAAWQAGISLNTAKTQLRSVFLKTGFERQKDLVADVMSRPVLRLSTVSALLER